MTHDEKRKRRKAMADAVLSGRSLSDVASAFGVSLSTVSAACRENGVDVIGSIRSAWKRKRDEIVAAARRGLNTLEISTLLGVSRFFVSHVCKENNVKPARWNPSWVRHRERPALDGEGRWAGVDWSLRDVEIARQVGVSRERVRQVRAKRRDI